MAEEDAMTLPPNQALLRNRALPPNNEVPRWFSSSARGLRQVNADAVGAFTDPASGGTIFALADGIGDDEQAARAASISVAAATHVAPSQGAQAAILAAQQAVHQDPLASDCVLVVAVPRTGVAGGYHIAWVGDPRAYSWTEKEIRQLTVDHTLGQYFRDRGEPTEPRMDHMVTTSIRTAHPNEIGVGWTTGVSGLLLTSDGVHKTLPIDALWSALRDPGQAAGALVESAISNGSKDNATALVVSANAQQPWRTGEIDPGPSTERFSINAA
jgi:protein phosphatase